MIAQIMVTLLPFSVLPFLSKNLENGIWTCYKMPTNLSLSEHILIEHVMFDRNMFYRGIDFKL